MKSLFIITIALISTSTFANVAIECGTGLNKDEATLKSREILISSESEILSGKAGGTWNLYDKNDKEIKNATLTTQGKNLILLVTFGRDFAGPVGQRYIIKNYSGENFTTAERVVVGGFAGGSVTGKYDCIVSEM